MTDFFDRLEDELRSAAARQDGAPASPGRFSRRARISLVAVASLAIAVPASAAVIEVFRPERESDGLIRTAPREVIATGESAEFGSWQAFRSDSTSGRCFGLRLIDPPGPERGSVSEGCGTADAPARIGGGDGPPRTALFGFVPAAADAVRLETDAGQVAEAPTERTVTEGQRFFFVSVPKNPDALPGLRVVAVDSNHAPVEP